MTKKYYITQQREKRNLSYNLLSAIYEKEKTALSDGKMEIVKMPHVHNHSAILLRMYMPTQQKLMLFMYPTDTTGKSIKNYYQSTITECMWQFQEKW